MICIAAFIIFGILSIFSVRYRPLAREAFRCVFRRIRLKPCDTGFDQRMRMAIVKRAMRRSPKLARFVYRHFESISWAFTALLFVSLAYTANGIWNLVAYGTCDPISGNCPFEFGAAVNATPYEGHFLAFVSPTCQHCVRMEPVVEQIENKTGISFVRINVRTKEGAAIFAQYVDNISRYCPLIGTPTFYHVPTGTAVCGEMPKEQLEQWVLSCQR